MFTANHIHTLADAQKFDRDFEANSPVWLFNLTQNLLNSIANNKLEISPNDKRQLISLIEGDFLTWYDFTCLLDNRLNDNPSSRIHVSILSPIFEFAFFYFFTFTVYGSYLNDIKLQTLCTPDDLAFTLKQLITHQAISCLNKIAANYKFIQSKCAKCIKENPVFNDLDMAKIKLGKNVKKFINFLSVNFFTQISEFTLSPLCTNPLEELWQKSSLFAYLDLFNRKHMDLPPNFNFLITLLFMYPVSFRQYLIDIANGKITTNFREFVKHYPFEAASKKTMDYGLAAIEAQQFNIIDFMEGKLVAEASHAINVKKLFFPAARFVTGVSIMATSFSIYGDSQTNFDERDYTSWYLASGSALLSYITYKLSQKIGLGTYDKIWFQKIDKLIEILSEENWCKLKQKFFNKTSCKTIFDKNMLLNKLNQLTKEQFKQRWCEATWQSLARWSNDFKLQFMQTILLADSFKIVDISTEQESIADAEIVMADEIKAKPLVTAVDTAAHKLSQAGNRKKSKALITKSVTQSGQEPTPALPNVRLVALPLNVTIQCKNYYLIQDRTSTFRKAYIEIVTSLSDMPPNLQQKYEFFVGIFRQSGYKSYSSKEDTNIIELKLLELKKRILFSRSGQYSIDEHKIPYYDFYAYIKK